MIHQKDEIFKMKNQYVGKNHFKIRNATEADLDNLMIVEQTWPLEQRATADRLLSRLKIFPEGFWVAELDDAVIGFSTSCPLHYSSSDLSRFNAWSQVTNNGYLFPCDATGSANALYVVSTVIMKEHRGKGLFEEFFRIHKEVTHQLGLAYSLTGAILPGYDAYCRKHGEVSAYHYATIHCQGNLVDPLIRKLTAVGYVLPDRNHLKADYFQSAPSRDYAAILVYRNESLNSC